MADSPGGESAGAAGGEVAAPVPASPSFVEAADASLAPSPGGDPGAAASADDDDPDQPPTACAFFMRTGTCAYGERCRFVHPVDRPPPQLNQRGYPRRDGGEESERRRARF